MMDYNIVNFKQRPDLYNLQDKISCKAFPAFLYYSEIATNTWDKMMAYYNEYQLLFLQEEKSPICDNYRTWQNLAFIGHSGSRLTEPYGVGNISVNFRIEGTLHQSPFWLIEGQRSNYMIGMLLVSTIFISSAVLLWFVADKRGANTFLWAFMGAFFGPLAIPFVFLTKNKSSVSKSADKS